MIHATLLFVALGAWEPRIGVIPAPSGVFRGSSKTSWATSLGLDTAIYLAPALPGSAASASASVRKPAGETRPPHITRHPAPSLRQAPS